MLTPTNFHTSESVAPGEGRGGGIGGGAPLRYAFTSRGWVALSPWNQSEFAYSILQLKLGSNFISKLEVVSSLNLFNQGRAMYYYTLSDCTSRYYPKVYLGTLGTVSYWWLCNRETDWILDSNTTPKLTWPQAFQDPQKGEANTEGKIICI